MRGLAVEYKHKRRDRQPLRPPIAVKCWDDGDIEFWLTGDYDMSRESPEVQIMLDLAGLLNDARVEWLLADARAQRHEAELAGYRHPKFLATLSIQRRGFDIHRE